ncbi:biosynthetic peptidoglycan transglycosylase [Chondromyces crocatus]|uniref:Monofunctional biosynthetic peptidoglycan transglycosylase n=1 Tax=Chondromyces crocatus TaxID=52 RepID=A0A0K1ELS4_CHOCO|nr:biosynthetic peptidoglycan transglycosylase [Chondromyces crocatus]AKT41855.1 monofunctional biosynthetic peptidoglycan transglycosylase [Chondromyces crocatus]
MRTRFKVAALIGIGLILALAIGVEPYVRYRARTAATAYHSQAEIRAVRLTWRGFRLLDTTLRLEDVPSATVHLPEIEVALRTSGPHVTLRGGTVSVVGARETVLRELQAWRARSRGSSRAGGGGRRLSSEVTGVNLDWKDQAEAPRESLWATGVQFSEDEAQVTLTADEARLGVRGSSLAVRNGRIVLLRGTQPPRIAAIETTGVEADIAVSTEGNTPVDGKEERSRASDDVGIALRSALVAIAGSVDGLLAGDAVINMGGVRGQLHMNAGQLGLGPGRLTIQRTNEALVAELAPEKSEIAEGRPDDGGAGAAIQPLLFRLRIPIRTGAGISQEISAELDGGPIKLSVLGVREGDLGLFDVAKTTLTTRARLVLSEDGRSLQLGGSGTLKNLSVRNSGLSAVPIEGMNVAWRADASALLDGSHVEVKEGEFALDDLRLLAKGEYHRTGKHFQMKGDAEVPLTSCQAMLDSLPEGIVEKVKPMRLGGTLGIKGQLRFDTSRLERDFHIDWRVSNTCKLIEVPRELSVERFRAPFKHKVTDPNGRATSLNIGPGTSQWVSYGSISRFMEVAVMTTEDSGFRRHGGFDQEAIKNSIRENLKQRRFVRGASTISMQLAKNLYLERSKTLSRKLQEAVLTSYLEQELTKDQIMELYLNVAEFGPMVYGIGSAAQHYFNTSAAHLSLSQCLYLASILPNPRIQHFAAGGAVSQGWTRYLRKLMETAAKRKWITEEELEEGLTETAVRGHPMPLRGPASRPSHGDFAGADEPDVAPDGE